MFYLQDSLHDIFITDINSQGDGVGRVNDWVIFVPNAVPEDLLKIKILYNKKNYSCGKIVEIIKPSKYRIAPLCKYFNFCGGCTLQNIKYEYQLHLKNEFLKNNLQKIGKINPDIIRKIIPSEREWNYRNKVQHIVSKVGNNIKVGFYRKNTHEVIDIKKCLIQHEVNVKLLNNLRILIKDLQWTIYNEKTHKGLLKHIIIKTSFSNNEILCTIVTKDNILPCKDKFIENLNTFPGLIGIVQNINKKKSNSILGEENITLYGRNYIIEDICGIKFKISTSSFFQVNINQLKKMYHLIADTISNLKIKTLIDAYCGIGTFSLFLSKKVNKIIGIEDNIESVNMAKENSILNNCKNLEFLNGKVENLLYNLANKDTIDLIILDPPRKGCELSVIEAIKTFSIPYIIYISCNPSTLARDLLIFNQGGYKIVFIQPIDMFPQTPHIESLAFICKSDM